MAKGSIYILFFPTKRRESPSTSQGKTVFTWGGKRNKIGVPGWLEAAKKLRGVPTLEEIALLADNIQDSKNVRVLLEDRGITRFNLGERLAEMSNRQAYNALLKIAELEREDGATELVEVDLEEAHGLIYAREDFDLADLVELKQVRTILQKLAAKNHFIVNAFGTVRINDYKPHELLPFSKAFSGVAESLSILLTDWQQRVMLFPADQPLEHDLNQITDDMFGVTPKSKVKA